MVLHAILQMSGSILQEKNSISLLGLTVSSDLSWKSYLQKVSKKAAQRIGSLYWASRYLPPESILYLYKAAIRPLMEYSTIVAISGLEPRRRTSNFLTA